MLEWLTWTREVRGSVPAASNMAMEMVLMVKMSPSSIPNRYHSKLLTCRSGDRDAVQVFERDTDGDDLQTGGWHQEQNTHHQLAGKL